MLKILNGHTVRINLFHFLTGICIFMPFNSALAQMAVANCLEESPHVGVAKGADANEANANAIAACIKNGGYQNCCIVYATIIHGASGQKMTCLAGAQGYNGDFGYGIGINRKDATAAAIRSCKINPIAPKQCVVKG
jgi:hypothetical protein